MTSDQDQDPHKLQLDEIHRLRGYFLSAVAELETMLDLLIRIYFHIPKGSTGEFTAWVLSSLNLASKVELVGKITRSSHPGSTMKAIVSNVKTLNNWRNEVAHAEVTLDVRPNQTISEAIADWKWAARRQTRLGTTTKLMDLDSLHEWLYSAQVTGAILLTVASEMAKAPNRIVPLDLDWRATYNDSLNEQGIQTISKELFDHFESAP